MVVAAITTATAAAMTATQRCGGNETATVMDGDGQSDSNASATTAMEGVTVMDGTTAMAINGATQRGGNDNNGSNGWRGGNGDCNGRHNGDSNGRRTGNVAVTTMMDCTTATRRQQRQWMAQR